jgi:hypothetical protein
MPIRDLSPTGGGGKKLLIPALPLNPLAARNLLKEGVLAIAVT